MTTNARTTYDMNLIATGLTLQLPTNMRVSYQPPFDNHFELNMKDRNTPFDMRSVPTLNPGHPEYKSMDLRMYMQPSLSGNVRTFSLGALEAKLAARTGYLSRLVTAAMNRGFTHEEFLGDTIPVIDAAQKHFLERDINFWHPSINNSRSQRLVEMLGGGLALANQHLYGLVPESLTDVQYVERDKEAKERSALMSSISLALTLGDRYLAPTRDLSRGSRFVMTERLFAEDSVSDTAYRH